MNGTDGSMEGLPEAQEEFGCRPHLLAKAESRANHGSLRPP